MFWGFFFPKHFRSPSDVLSFCLVDGPIKFDFAILVASFKSNSQQHQYLYETKVTIPTLHVFGETDGVIPKGE